MSSAPDAGSVAPAARVPDRGVLLHIGVHKTGTTALQAAFQVARPELRKSGVLYPGRGRAQHEAAMAVLDRYAGWRNAGGAPPKPEVWTALVRKSRKFHGRTVISSEFFAEADADSAARIVSDLGRDRTHVVVTLRNLQGLLPSAWQQYLKSGLTLGYDKWLKGVLADPPNDKVTPTFWKRHDHPAVVRRWAEAVGPERLTVVVVDGDRSAIFRAFEQMLDLPPRYLEDQPTKNVNRSMTAGESEVLRRFNASAKKSMAWSDYRVLVRRGIIGGMIDHRVPGPDEPKITTPAWAVERASQIAAGYPAAIESIGVNVVGDLSLLALPGVPPDTAAEKVDSIPVDAAVAALNGLLNQVGRDAAAESKDEPTRWWRRIIPRQPDADGKLQQ